MDSCRACNADVNSSSCVELAYREIRFDILQHSANNKSSRYIHSNKWKQANVRVIPVSPVMASHGSVEVHLNGLRTADAAKQGEGGVSRTGLGCNGKMWSRRSQSDVVGGTIDYTLC